MVERLYPGVYVTEIPFAAKPIDGVATSPAQNDLTATASRSAALPSVAAPDWTRDNGSDPGVTFLQLSAWLGESLLFRAPANAGFGVAHGLALEPRDTSDSPDVTVSGGLAIGVDGRPLESESSRSAHHVRKP
jgi:hypothetical protein